MKTRFYFPMIISLLVISVSLLTACGDSDNPLSAHGRKYRMGKEI